MNKNIKILINEIDISNILKEINAKPENWLVDTRRQTILNHLHQHTEVIHLVKGHETDPNPEYKDARHSQAYKPTPLYEQYPETLKTLKSFFPIGLSRIAIVKLKAGKRVYPHFDHGKYYEARNRYHIVVTGSYEYTVGNETQRVSSGMLFWFNNQETHSAFNDSAEDRISIIFDVEK